MVSLNTRRLITTTKSGDSANLDGTGVTTLVTGLDHPAGVAVDASHIYWSENGSGTIMAANLDGTGVTALVPGQDQPERGGGGQ